MRQDAAGRWISDDGEWVFEAVTDRWLPRRPSVPPPSEVVVPPPPPSEVVPGVVHANATSAPPALMSALPPAPASGGFAAVPTEAGSLADVGLLDAATVAEMPPGRPVGSPSGGPAGSAEGTRPGLVAGARPAGRHASRAGAAPDLLATLLTPRRLIALGGVLALLVVAVVLVAGRGGGGSRTARPASSAAAIVTASPAAYPAPAQQAFLDACVGATPERRPFCSCSLDQIQHQMPWAEFRQVGQQATNGDPAARARYTTMVAACTSQLPRAGT